MKALCSLIGRGPLLIACAEALRNRGYGIYGVISDCEHTAAWCDRHGITRLGTDGDQLAFLSREPFDYLFSIVNHSITAPEILALARKLAINFHDSLLPDYAGFNAVAWAILDGRERHGITWHRMAQAVDQGDILVAESVEIADDDTAFTLSTRCGEAALRGFEKLLNKIESGDLAGTAQGPVQHFHKRSQRPGVGLLDFRQAAPVLARFVHGLDFGPDENWLTTPKLRGADGTVLRVGEAVVRGGEAAAAPGTIIAENGDELLVATGGGTLAISELTTLTGTVVSAEFRKQLGLVQGSTLRLPDERESARLNELDANLTGTERFWVKRLARCVPSSLGELVDHDGDPEPGVVRVPMPDAISRLPATERECLLLAAITAYVARVGVAAPVSLGFSSQGLSDAEANFFSRFAPLIVEFPPDATWARLKDSVRAELDVQRKRNTFALDVYLRYPSLRNRESATRYPIVVSSAAISRLPHGARLGFDIGIASGEMGLTYDRRAIDEPAALALARRVVNLASQGEVAGDRAIAALSVLSDPERELLLDVWQQTKADFPRDKCVHQIFEQQVAATPDQTALVFEDNALSYRELDERANAVAVTLQKLGVRPDDLVGVCVRRSLDMMVALLGVLKAGAAYVPLDPNYPAERLSIMIEDSKARALITQEGLRSRLPAVLPEVVLLEDVPPQLEQRAASDVLPSHLAYVIFTSGSTGRPKGVMVQHANVVNFFTGMDAVLGTEPGVWLAVTSISFDISVLELFWTLARGYKVVIQEEGDRASMLASNASVSNAAPMGFGLFYFAANSSDAPSQGAYKLLLDGARFADAHDFVAVWTPERHFHAFGGLYPNPAVTTAALATITSRVELRAGSVVIPLHNPLRVAEDWSVVDNLSGGRIGLSFASGWHVNDFALMPNNYERRREIMVESIQTVLRLWRGESVSVPNGAGELIQVKVLPRPVRQRPPIWMASAGNVETFRIAGRAGFNILTNMLGQDLKSLQEKFAAYREARKEHGHEGEGIISVMLHTFVSNDDERVRELARDPFCNYLESSYDLVKVAPWMFPAFKQPSQASQGNNAFDPSSFDDEDRRALLDHAFERYFDTAGLFGTPERALGMVDQLKDVGANEVSCLIDFGIEPNMALESLVHLDRLRQLSNPVRSTNGSRTRRDIAAQLTEHGVTHLQCTPSMARMLLTDGTLPAMGELKALLLGGEALPEDLVDKLASRVTGDIINMYGPTETTIWSTFSQVAPGSRVTIGRPLANTWIRIVDSKHELCPVGTPGELCIGGAGVVRGYLGRPELTRERFVDDPCGAGRMYRTGDRAKYLPNGELQYLGRLDDQVKFNGYRIELGEIEAIMRKHPDVHDAVVCVRGEGGREQLVGYFVPRGRASEGREASQSVAAWGQRWNEAYERRVGAEQSSGRFDTSGWLDSFSGEPYPEAIMRRWLDHTLGRITRAAPRRVLELGCGTGMILFGCLPSVEHYTGLDLSGAAIARIRNQLTAEEVSKVTLLNQPAHAVDDVDDASVDVVVLNSVAQYFPSSDYLDQVLDSVAPKVVEGGRMLIGDIRSLAHLDLFHALVELHQAPGGTARTALLENIRERTSNEPELLIHPEYFSRWVSRRSGWCIESIDLKHTSDQSEMTLFRYDVVLRKDRDPKPLDLRAADVLESPQTEADIASRLASRPPLLLVRSAMNARLAAAVELRRQLATDANIDAGSLRANLAGLDLGIDPAAVGRLDGDYSVEIRWGAKPEHFDALFRHRAQAPSGDWQMTPVAAGATAPLTNAPALQKDDHKIAAGLRKHIREFLPDYMLPSALVMLDGLPLTPNGKIDRKALPEPQKGVGRARPEEYKVPTNDFERIVATIWQGLLGVEKVGTRDNIFDLGASSLLTVEANNLLQAQLGRKIPLVSMFRFPTVEKLAAHLGAAVKSDAGELQPAQPKQTSEAAERRLRARSRLRR